MQHDFEAKMKIRNLQSHAERIGKHATMETYQVEQNRVYDERMNATKLLVIMKQAIQKVTSR